MDLLQIAIGLALLLAGGDLLVRGAVRVAADVGASPLFAGIFIVGIGTSVPELATSVNAAWRDAAGVAIGNVVGSNIANILLVLGTSALVAPLPCDPAATRRDSAAVGLATVVVTALLLTGTLERWAGLVLLAGLAVYLAVLMRSLPGPDETTVPPRPRRRIPHAGLLVALPGGAMVIGGAHILVGGAVAFAEHLGVSEALIGVTIVALGTSAPELSAGMVAVLRGQTDVAVGNVFGSTLFNLLGILGATAVTTPTPVPGEILHFDLWVMLVAVAALIVFTRTGRRVSRLEGAVLLAGYPLYMVALLG